MARIISIVNQKGGVGKTTTTVNVASFLAKEGQRVLLVDMDAQGNATSGVGLDPRNLPHSMYDVLTNTSPIADALFETVVSGLHIIPANVDLAGAAIELVNQEEREYRLQHALTPLIHAYDFILIDCPPSLGLLTINGIVAASEILIPVQAEYYALEGLGQLLRTIELVQQHLRPDVRVLGAVLTMHDRRNRLSQEVFEEMYKHFPHHVFRTTIPRNVRLAEAPSFGKPISEFDRFSKGARAYAKLAKEIILKNSSSL